MVNKILKFVIPNDYWDFETFCKIIACLGGYPRE